ncbi:MAG: hypothetical protein HY744_17465 [Deltaproteobacteria bacterium]|nr:hypothetical protein [Deltaproteobacteria bacterium]
MAESRAGLIELFDAERKVRAVHDALARRGRAAMLAPLRAAVAEAGGARAAPGLGPEEAELRLVCVARLLGEFDGQDVVDLLIDVLGSDYPEARGEAGEQLRGLALERFEQVARGVERALERLPAGSPALVELPQVLLEIPEPGAALLVRRFVAHRDPDAVGSAIEALAELGDREAVALLEPLCEDGRVARVGDEELTEVTVGELAREAIELLREGEVADRDGA